ncbi:MAG: translation initiation factor IF-2 N-terminal domain-containing protein, partial [Lachnospiraceae bacterium]|nr:translation initiation factor IF-2 N-terminal domain-containing protein [Lachnospiraceae bacterium]
MGKMRVYELAKELNIQNKDIIAYLEENGVKGKVPANTLEEDIVAKVKQKFAAGASKAVEAKAPSAKVDEAKAPAAEKTT